MLKDTTKVVGNTARTVGKTTQDIGRGLERGLRNTFRLP
jgi:hypothetical protein